MLRILTSLLEEKSKDMETLPHEKGFHISWEQIHRDSRALAWRLEKMAPESTNWKAVIAVTRGGMVPAMVVARELDLRIVETISVKSYDHQVQSDAKILKIPAQAYVGDGDGILIVDDLVDTGSTMAVVQDMIPGAHIATVYAKPEGLSNVDTFVTEVSQDTWIYFPWDTELQFSPPINPGGV